MSAPAFSVPSKRILSECGNAPLAGVRIIDISTVMAAPFSTQILADFGAEVIKVEEPRGDIMRQSGPSPQPNMSPIFQHLNRNKQGITLDLKHPKGLATLTALLKGADVLVYNMRPPAMCRLGLGYEQVKKINNQLIYCGIVGYREEGPYANMPAYDDLIQGAAAIPDMISRALGGEPRFIPFALVDRIVGLYAVNAIIAALFRQTRQSEGCALEIPMFETAAHFLLVEHMFQRSFSPPTGSALNPRMMEPDRRPYATKDGYICVLPYTDKHWESLFILAERPDLLGKQKFKTFPSRRENVRELYSILASILATKTTDEWFRILREADIPISRSNTVEELLNDPHLKAIGFFRHTRQPGMKEEFIHLSYPCKWSNWNPEAPRPAPRLSEHSRQILKRAGFNSKEITELINEGVTHDGQ